jgi:hypothetical protein
VVFTALIYLYAKQHYVAIFCNELIKIGEKKMEITGLNSFVPLSVSITGTKRLPDDVS